jgi:membrane fusion protein, multidrug efflux system
MRTGRSVAIAAVVIGIGLGGWLLRGHDAARSAAAPQPNPAIPVTAGTAQAQDVPVYVRGIGTVQAINTVNVKTRVDGQMMQAFFTQGQEVQQNGPLFLIDPRPFQAALDEAKANAAKDTAQLQGAQRDLTRYGKLVGSGFQTRQSFEDQQATVAQLQGAVQADNAAIEAAQLNLGFTMIRAPIGGRTGARLVDPGNYVQASAATPLVSITQVRPIYVSFTLPATNLDAIRQSDAAQHPEVDAYSADGKTLLGKGVLSFIDNHVDISTGTIALKGTFENTNERLWPGEFVNARLILSVRHNAITVPAETVMAGSNGDYVYVIGPNDTVQRRAVQLASRQEGLAVITKGLAAGEKVVVAGQYRLANDVKVKIETTGAPAAPAQQDG